MLPSARTVTNTTSGVPERHNTFIEVSLRTILLGGYRTCPMLTPEDASESERVMQKVGLHRRLTRLTGLFKSVPSAVQVSRQVFCTFTSSSHLAVPTQCPEAGWRIGMRTMF